MPNEPQVRLLSSSSLCRLLLTRALCLLEECVLERGHCACRNRARELHCTGRQGIQIQVSCMRCGLWCMRCGLWCMRWGVMGVTGHRRGSRTPSQPFCSLVVFPYYQIQSIPMPRRHLHTHTHARTPHDVMETSVFFLSKTFENS